MVIIQSSKATYRLQTILVVNAATESVRGVVGVDDKTPLTKDFDRPLDQARLRIFRMDLEKL